MLAANWLVKGQCSNNLPTTSLPTYSTQVLSAQVQVRYSSSRYLRRAWVLPSDLSTTIPTLGGTLMPYQLMHSMMAMQSLCNAAALGASVNVISCQFENTILFLLAPRDCLCRPHASRMEPSRDIESTPTSNRSIVSSDRSLMKHEGFEQNQTRGVTNTWKKLVNPKCRCENSPLLRRACTKVRMPMRCSSPLSCVVRKELAVVRRLLP